MSELRQVRRVLEAKGEKVEPKRGTKGKKGKGPGDPWGQLLVAQCKLGMRIHEMDDDDLYLAAEEILQVGFTVVGDPRGCWLDFLDRELSREVGFAQRFAGSRRKRVDLDRFSVDTNQGFLFVFLDRRRDCWAEARAHVERMIAEK